VDDGRQSGVGLKNAGGNALGGACATEAGEIRRMPDSVKLSPLPHGHPALKGEGRRWKRKAKLWKKKCRYNSPGW